MNNNVPPYRPLELMEDPNLTKSDFTDFIGVWENFVPGPFCDEMINHFEHQLGMTASAESLADIETGSMDGTKQFAQGNLGRKDTSLLINYSSNLLSAQVNQFLYSCISHYATVYSQLKTAPLISTDIKMQKTPPGGGYHMWHYENSSWGFAQRELVWAIYLNDIPDGEGETEFLYQKRRIKPTKGTVVIWPAGMTHVHKGNTVFTQDKYILTGWYIRVPR
jgi:hypothetical protein